MERIAVVGAGLIGRAWAMVFARAGCSVALWDKLPGVADAAMEQIRARLGDLQAAGLVEEAPATIAARIEPAATLDACLAGAVHVQEQGPERVEVKRELFAELDERSPPRARCLIAHPVNPPYLVPLVELVGAPWTSPDAVARTRALMHRVGQVPVTAMKETRGFVLNRMQAALVAEAFRLVLDGVMSVEDVDACVRDGLGLRWSFMGPFETIDLNAPGGVADYAARFGPLLGSITAEQAPYDFDATTVDKVAGERRAALPLAEIEERSAWRDRRLMALLAHRRRQEP
jgi:L-gulonate 3-dehydrogenase